jgi:hypothetical protein
MVRRASSAFPAAFAAAAAEQVLGPAVGLRALAAARLPGEEAAGPRAWMAVMAPPAGAPAAVWAASSVAAWAAWSVVA